MKQSAACDAKVHLWKLPLGDKQLAYCWHALGQQYDAALRPGNKLAEAYCEPIPTLRTRMPLLEIRAEISHRLHSCTPARATHLPRELVWTAGFASPWPVRAAKLPEHARLHKAITQNQMEMMRGACAFTGTAAAMAALLKEQLRLIRLG